MLSRPATGEHPLPGRNDSFAFVDLPNGSDQDIAAWDRIAESYVSVAGSAGTITSRFAGFLAQAVGEPAGLDILDLGCGYGWLAGSLRESRANVKGVDGSRELLKTARARYPHIEFHQADLVVGLPRQLASDRFDRVIALMVLMDIPDIDRLLADVAQCLRPDGRFVLTMPHPAFFSHPVVSDETTGERYRKVAGYLVPEQRWVKSCWGPPPLPPAPWVVRRPARQAWLGAYNPV